MEQLAILTIIGWAVSHAIFRTHAAKWAADALDSSVSDDDVQSLRSNSVIITEYQRVKAGGQRGKKISEDRLAELQAKNKSAMESNREIKSRYKLYIFLAAILTCKYCQGVWSGAIVGATALAATGEIQSLIAIASTALASHAIPSAPVRLAKFPSFGLDCASCRSAANDKRYKHNSDGSVTEV